jgi:diacylglycerol diphosphate phosphatase/phosphatidate phosphatase
MFFLDNINIQYPHAANERVPLPWLFLYAGAIPLIIVLIYTLLFNRSTHKAHVTALGLLTSLVLTSFTTDVIKNAVGRPRPDLLARCKPANGTPPHTLVTQHVCTEPNPHVLHDGWRSFPSGHSSFAFAGLAYLSFFLAGQMYVLRPHADLARCLVAGAPLLGAALIAISRCEDYRHDVYDVTCGAFLGFGIAWFCYRRHYPPLRAMRCDEPFAAPVLGTDGRIKDEEARIAGAREYEVGGADADADTGSEDGSGGDDGQSELRLLTASAPRTGSER